MKNTDIALYMKQANKYPLITKEEEEKLIQRIKKGDQKAENKLIQSNLKFVVKIAYRFRNYCIHSPRVAFSDLIQAGNEGLLKAAKRFDPNKKCRFLSYATWWINACIKQTMMTNSSYMHVVTSQPQRALFFRWADLDGIQFAEVDQREQARIDLAKKAKVKLSDVYRAEESLRANYVLLHEAPSRHREKNNKVYESIIGQSDDVEQNIQKNQVNALLKKALESDQLNERERNILKERFLEGKTLQQIGKSQDCCRENIRQIQRRALSKMRKALDEYGVTPEDVYI